MKRQIGSAISAVALLTIAVGAAAVNVRILHANQSDTSVLNVQQAADVTTLTNPTADPTSAAAVTTTTQEPTDVVAVESTPSAKPTPNDVPSPKPRNGQSRMALGTVGGGGDDDGEDGEDGEHEFGTHGPRGGFMQLSPEQMALLRVARLAQVSPMQARDAARGFGPAPVIDRVKSAANVVGVPLSDLATVTDLPPERRLGHGGDDAEHEGDDDD